MKFNYKNLIFILFIKLTNNLTIKLTIIIYTMSLLVENLNQNLSINVPSTHTFNESDMICELYEIMQNYHNSDFNQFNQFNQLNKLNP